jgi:hypothetical protein
MSGNDLLSELEQHEYIYLREKRANGPDWYIRVPAENLEEFAGELSGAGVGVLSEFDKDGDLVLSVQFVIG